MLLEMPFCVILCEYLFDSEVWDCNSSSVVGIMKSQFGSYYIPGAPLSSHAIP